MGIKGRERLLFGSCCDRDGPEALWSDHPVVRGQLPGISSLQVVLPRAQGASLAQPSTRTGELPQKAPSSPTPFSFLKHAPGQEPRAASLHMAGNGAPTEVGQLTHQARSWL